MAGNAAARVYADALLDAAGTSAAQVRDELWALAALADESPETWEGLLDPQLTSGQRKSVLDRIFESGSPITRHFLRVLVDRDRLEELPGIVEQYSELVKALEQQLDVRIVTAVELPADLQQRIEQRLSESTGSTVRLHPSVDPSIIGGLVIQHGDTLIDSSIRSRLEQIRLNFKRSASTPS